MRRRELERRGLGRRELGREKLRSASKSVTSCSLSAHLVHKLLATSSQPPKLMLPGKGWPILDFQLLLISLLFTTVAEVSPLFSLRTLGRYLVCKIYDGAFIVLFDIAVFVHCWNFFVFFLGFSIISASRSVHFMLLRKYF